ncbi:MAG: DUF2752 domain-containing protein [Phycicoccus sp.]|uniref:DUF2752 domain-containing protein n=1 Tax=Phycicoccus sp. TaxID=1902410 RepID=UPI0025827CD7|nr:DUF2752 domain-containing protein [Phycicoccus sp.]MCO5304293.1 DUF2752 domain-containing protein [Phycicoccus sp.]
MPATGEATRRQPAPAGGHAPVERGRLGRLAGPLALGAATAVLTARVWAVDPHQAGHYPLCPIFAVTGLYCPGCGTLRATHALLHGDVGTAFHDNAIWPVLAVVLVVLWLKWVAARWSGRHLDWNPPRWFPWVLAGGVLAFTLVRNLSVGAFLAPI